jgi:hypothetical protein
MSGPWYMIIPHILCAGGVLATAGLGMYLAVEGGVSNSAGKFLFVHITLDFSASG